MANERVRIEIGFHAGQALSLMVEQTGFRPRTVARDIAPRLHRGINRVDARQATLDQSAPAQCSRPDVPLQLGDPARIGRIVGLP